MNNLGKILQQSLLSLALAGIWATTHAQSLVPPPSRGELLYTTHCIACHNAQVHWRDQRLAEDWPSLLAQVQRWQATALLAWSDDDVTEVARFLNDTVYRYPQTTGRVSLGPAPPATR